ncbi:MAG: GNAT family N-acetyltransferase [Phenylobacterium sp.]|uniref:GNAT family N-acetyltransferase n=1 Tax=Phenylobacterium sp. TaxID=1871053 RepID=UPI00391C8519
MIADPLPGSPLNYALETPDDGAAVEALLDHAFGPGRFVKVSERVREFAEFRPDLSFCAWDGDRLVGSVRMWKVHVAGRPIIFLGPLAVEADARKHGTGTALVARACAAAEAAGYPTVVLVGDEPYFARVGFSAATTRELRLPGPVDQRRVLARGAPEPLVGDLTA